MPAFFRYRGLKMKLRLTQSGFETYNGQMGVIMFENGVSVDDVLPVDAIRMSAVMGAEWENGSPSNVAQIYLDNMNTPATSEAAVEQEATTTEPVELKEPQNTYTKEDLEKIADTGGITALREIAEPLGLKGNSIGGMIKAILSASTRVTM